MNDKEILKLMKRKQEDENNNFSFFGSTGLQAITKKDNIEVIGRFCPELQAAWIYPDKIYQGIYSISEVYDLIK